MVLCTGIIHSMDLGPFNDGICYYRLRSKHLIYNNPSIEDKAAANRVIFSAQFRSRLTAARLRLPLLVPGMYLRPWAKRN